MDSTYDASRRVGIHTWEWVLRTRKLRKMRKHLAQFSTSLITVDKMRGTGWTLVIVSADKGTLASIEWSADPSLGLRLSKINEVVM